MTDEELMGDAAPRGHLRRLGPADEVLRWAEECRRLNRIQRSQMASAEAQGISHLIEVHASPIRPQPVELLFARSLSDDADDDLTLPDADLPTV